MEGHKIHINNQTHTIKLRSKDVIVAQAQMPGGKSLLQALALGDRDMAAVCIGFAAGIRHEYEGQKNNKAPGPATIADWFDREPAKYREAEIAVLRAAEDHYVTIGRLDRGDLTGEARPATTPPSPAGSPSFASPADGSSTPTSSDG